MIPRVMTGIKRRLLFYFVSAPQKRDCIQEV